MMQLIDDCHNYYQSLKPTVIDKVNRFSPPCSKILCFNQEDWIALNEYFVTTCCIADLLSHCKQKQCDISVTIIEDYLKRFKDLEEKVYTALRVLV